MNVTEVIERRIAEILADEDVRYTWLRAGIRQHHFLPLQLGWTEVLGIRPDGALVRWPYEEHPASVFDLVQPYWQRLALVQGSMNYPELGFLVPQRPEGAVDCPLCNGAGHLPGHPHIVCECGGVGWQIPGEKHSSSPV